MDGSEYRNSRTISRSITVGYQLLTDSPEDFREKFNALNKILNQKEAKLIFADEPDKYFIGTKSKVGDVKEGQLNVTGEFVFTAVIRINMRLQRKASRHQLMRTASWRLP